MLRDMRHANESEERAVDFSVTAPQKGCDKMYKTINESGTHVYAQKLRHIHSNPFGCLICGGGTYGLRRAFNWTSTALVQDESLEECTRFPRSVR